MKQSIPITKQRNSPQSITPNGRQQMFGAKRLTTGEGSCGRYMGIRTEEVEANKQCHLLQAHKLSQQQPQVMIQNFAGHLIKTPDRIPLNKPPSLPLTGDRASFLDSNPFSESDDDTNNNDDIDENKVQSKQRLRVVVSSSSNSEEIVFSQVKDEKHEQLVLRSVKATQNVENVQGRLTPNQRKQQLQSKYTQKKSPVSIVPNSTQNMQKIAISHKKQSLLPPTAPLTKRSISPKQSLYQSPKNQSSTKKKSILFNKQGTSDDSLRLSVSQSRKESLLYGGNAVQMPQIKLLDQERLKTTPTTDGLYSPHQNFVSSAEQGDLKRLALKTSSLFNICPQQQQKKADNSNLNHAEYCTTEVQVRQSRQGSYFEFFRGENNGVQRTAEFNSNVLYQSPLKHMQTEPAGQDDQTPYCHPFSFTPRYMKRHSNSKNAAVELRASLVAKQQLMHSPVKEDQQSSFERLETELALKNIRAQNDNFENETTDKKQKSKKSRNLLLYNKNPSSGASTTLQHSRIGSTIRKGDNTSNPSLAILLGNSEAKINGQLSRNLSFSQIQILQKQFMSMPPPQETPPSESTTTQHISEQQ